MVLRSAYASEAVEQAVVDGITRHGEDFQLVVQPTAAVRPENTVAVLPPEDDAESSIREDVRAGRPQAPRD
jgi:hypothetical protein